MNYLEWEAMIACGATLTEILEWERGEAFICEKGKNGIYKLVHGIEKFPNWMKAKILAFHELSILKHNHIQDAATPK